MQKLADSINLRRGSGVRVRCGVGENGTDQVNDTCTKPTSRQYKERRVAGFPPSKRTVFDDDVRAHDLGRSIARHDECAGGVGHEGH